MSPIVGACSVLALLAYGSATPQVPSPPAAQHPVAPRTKQAPLSCRLADRLVEAAVAALVRKEHALEYCQERRYDIADVDGDSLDDLIATFTLEDRVANDLVRHFLLVSTTRGGERRPLILEIGSKWSRMPDFFYVDGRFVVMNFLVWRPDDAGCCPSDSATVRFLVTHDSIIEQVPSNKRLQRRDTAP